MSDSTPAPKPPEGTAYGWEQADPRFAALVRGPIVRAPCQCVHCQIARQHAEAS